MRLALGQSGVPHLPLAFGPWFPGRAPERLRITPAGPSGQAGVTTNSVSVSPRSGSVALCPLEGPERPYEPFLGITRTSGPGLSQRRSESLTGPHARGCLKACLAPCRDRGVPL